MILLLVIIIVNTKCQHIKKKINKVKLALINLRHNSVTFGGH